MASGEEPGTVRIIFEDSEGYRKVPVVDFETVETSSAAKAYPADRDALALPTMPPTNMYVDEGGKITVAFRASTSGGDIVESEESSGSIPIVLVDKKTSAPRYLKLRLGDDAPANFTGFASTADVTVTSTKFTDLGSYTVPQGYKATLWAGQRVHAYIGDDA